MQRYKIIHRTYYNYSTEVMLGPQRILLRPREDHELRLESFALNINPAANVLWHRDAEGNSVATATFATRTSQLLIESEAIIQQYNEQPLDFLVADYALSYPFIYKPEERVLLTPYMDLPEKNVLASINLWMKDIWQHGENIQTFSLLERICETIFKNLTYGVREEPGVQTAQYTLTHCSGSCRDFALLFLQTARSLGLAARFVSGYLNAPQMSNMIGSTHAWAEVYLPGAGWKGFDPTIGKIAGTDHFAVAVAREAESVPPVGGSFAAFVGQAAPVTTLDVGVWVRTY